MPTTTMPDVPPLYYLDNFRTVLAWVNERYADLLDGQERAFIRQFGELATPSQALLVRLIMRKGVHFRKGKLTYAEIGDIALAATPLRALGWLRAEEAIDIQTLFSLLRRDEILAQLPLAQSLRASSKGVILEALGAVHIEAHPFNCWCPDMQEELYSLTINGLCDRLRLMFFGNLSQTWAEFVLADLGIFRYESVNISPESRGFRSREDVDQYLHLRECREAFEGGESITKVLQRVGDFTSANAYLQQRHGKLLFSLARQLEREGLLEPALAVHQQCSYAGARQRCIRILEKLERYQDAYVLASLASNQPESDAEQQLVERALIRLGRKLGQSARTPQVKFAVNTLLLLLPRPDHGSVERAVCEHISTPEAPVHYVENALISSLFGLLCWDAIFAPLSGAFFHPFQTGPQDLHTADFYPRRAALFNRSLACLQTGTYQQVIRDTYAAKFGIQSPFVFWGISMTLLEQALSCLPAAHLEQWFQRMLVDLRANRTGMPDLIQFWPDEKRYRMIEVKGPGDRLQDNQRRWIAFCNQHGMPVDVCHVQWLEA